MTRSDGRRWNEHRQLHIERGYQMHPHGSVLISMGNTKVICSVTVEERVPPWMRGMGQGWITAEYSMLPGATTERTAREAARGKLGGRTHEIQRLIGRSMRSVVDLQQLGERTLWVDCDVIQADGGTRTTAITGAYVALVDALAKMRQDHGWEKLPVKQWLAAISVGIVDDTVLVDLCYEEDVRAQVDMNLVMTGDERVVEIQGTAEGEPFTVAQMNALFSAGAQGIKELIAKQRAVLGALAEEIGSE